MELTLSIRHYSIQTCRQRFICKDVHFQQNLNIEKLELSKMSEAGVTEYHPNSEVPFR